MRGGGSLLPLAATVEPTTQDELVGHLRGAYESATPVYAIGGGTSLGYGLPAKEKGLGLRLAALNRVVDYPSRDMTVTVEAGITMAALAAELARHGQRLPVDAAQAEQATLGGMIATNFSGPRRFGWGTLRDYVIGISAVDGRGTPFKAGGRVVKNVAGYDLCKLLTGSLGTLAVITQATLKVRPVPEATAFAGCTARTWDEAESLLSSLVGSRTTPAAIELLRGPHWQPNAMLAAPVAAAGRLLVGFEGSKSEINWQIEQLAREWREQGVAVDTEREEAAGATWRQLTALAASDAPLVVKVNVRPGALTSILSLLAEIDPQASVQSHAGNGIAVAAFSQFSPQDASRVLIQQLQPAAVAAEGNVVVWSCPTDELTRQATWGAAPADAALMRSVRDQFDPKRLLNRGRFLYGGL
ncbi:MAG TPA: FAD-binding oxidoreductase [Pirellulales bacterium]|jgi:glycolate oxidase FAD binding subunit|nr:FAD-binding oxidoreductase [Pirellulales bacterium]